MTLLLFVTACGGANPGDDSDATATSTAQPGEATATIAATAASTPLPGIPTATAMPSPTATPVSIDIDISGLEAVVVNVNLDGEFGAMGGLDVGLFDMDTEFLAGIDAPTHVALPSIDFELDLP